MVGLKSKYVVIIIFFLDGYYIKKHEPKFKFIFISFSLDYFFIKKKMGSSISKSKIFDMPKQEHRCSTASSQRTMVAEEPLKTHNKKPFMKPKFFRNKQSLSKRKHYKRKSVVTKSIIGRPTNFKVCFFYSSSSSLFFSDLPW